MIRRAYDEDNERAILRFNGPYLLPPFGPSFNGAERPRTAYDQNNERAILKFNGPYLLPPFGPSFNGVVDSQGVQITRAVKHGNVKIYGTPLRKAHRIEEDSDQKE